MLVPLPTKSLHPFRGLSPYHMGAQRLVPLPEFERVFFQDYSGWMGEAVRRGLIRPQETLPTHGPDGRFLTLFDISPDQYPMAEQGEPLWFRFLVP